MAGCFVPGTPNRGFRVEILIAVNQGFPSFPVYIPAPKAGTVTSGNTYAYRPGDPPPTGSARSFSLRISNSSGQFDVINGGAPYVWRISAVSGWGVCSGLSNFFHPEPGGTIEPTYFENGRFNFFPFTSPAVNQHSQAIELQAYIDGINTTIWYANFPFCGLYRAGNCDN